MKRISFFCMNLEILVVNVTRARANKAAVLMKVVVLSVHT